MASRSLHASLAYPRRGGSVRSATRLDYRALILVVGLLALAAFAGVLYLSQASVVAELRFRLGDMERETEALFEQNLALQQEIADQTRLAAVEDRAKRLGMVDAPLAGPYLACEVPQTNVSRAQPPVAAREEARPQEPTNPWREFLRWLGLLPSPGPEQLVALGAGNP